MFFLDVKEADAWISEAEQQGAERGLEFAEETQMFKDLFTPANYVKETKKVKSLNILSQLKDNNFIRIQDNKTKALKSIFLTFDQFISESKNKQDAALVGALLKSTSAWQGHFIRRGSPVRFSTLEKGYDDQGNRLFTTWLWAC